MTATEAATPAPAPAPAPPPGPGRALSVEEAYAEVGRVTRERAKNFAFGIMVLPKPKRHAVAAIYAYARLTDDIADGDIVVPDKRQALLDLRAALHAPAPADDAMWVALADARSRYPISTEALAALCDGGLQDMDQQRYADIGELVGYCRKVAGAVGVACTAVYGADEPALAETLGIALQLVNIMRDVPEDWALGRVYLPQDELAAFGVTEDDLAAGVATPQFRKLMAYQGERARTYLAEGRELLPHLDRRSRACVATFATLYEAILEQIEASGYDVFTRRPSVPTARKLAIVGRGLVPL